MDLIININKNIEDKNKIFKELIAKQIKVNKLGEWITFKIGIKNSMIYQKET